MPRRRSNHELGLGTEYKGHRISFDENLEVWQCTELSFSSESLAKIKAKIDNLSRKDRKLNIEAYWVQRDRWRTDKFRFEKVRVTTLGDEPQSWASRQAHIVEADGARRKVPLNELVTLSAHNMLGVWKEHAIAAEKSVEDAEAILEEIKRNNALVPEKIEAEEEEVA